MKIRCVLNIPPETIRIPFVIAAIGIYLGFIAACHFLLLNPQIKHYSDLRQKQSSLNELYLQVRAADIERILNALQQEANYMLSAKQYFAQRCLSPGEFSNVINDLNRLAQKNKLKVLSIDPLSNPGKVLNNYQKKLVALRLTGSYEQVLSLLNDLRNMPYWLLVENLSIVYSQPPESIINLTVFTITG